MLFILWYMTVNKVLIFTYLLLCHHFLSAQQTIYVTENGSGAKDGKSWESARSDLFQVLLDAHFGDRVWVGKGLYKLSGNDRYASFVVKKGVHLYGGFAGTESSIDERDLLQNTTVLSGEIGQTSVSDNVFHVLYGNGVDSSTVVDGFQITGGYGVGSILTASDDKGGGAYFVLAPNSGPQIRNCHFYRNASNFGGGIYFAENQANTGGFTAGPLLSACQFDRNYALFDGGAILKQGPASKTGALRILDCVFTNNRAKQGGGGGLCLSKADGSKLLLQNCLFERDSAIDGGAVFFLSESQARDSNHVTLDGCRFLRNYALQSAGFYYTETLSIVEGQEVYSNMVINSCLFEENKCSNDGTALFIAKGRDSKQHFDMTRCTFKRNKTIGGRNIVFFPTSTNGTSEMHIGHCVFSGNGSSIYTNTVYMEYEANARANQLFENCVFEGNSTGVSCASPEVARIRTVLTNCTFYNNGKYIFKNSWYLSYITTDTIYSTMTLQNCIIEEPQTDRYNMFSDNEPTLNISTETFALHRCLLSLPEPPLGATTVWPSSNRFGIDPMFVDAQHGDFRLKPCSPAIGTGDNQYAFQNNLLTDLDGRPRILFKNIDLGAYEQTDSCGVSGASTPFGPQHPSLRVWPNPSLDGQITFDMVSAHDEIKYIWVYDAFGQKVWEKTVALGQNTADISLLPEGVYWILFEGNLQMYRTKWVRINE